ncbi:hypothetical protein BB934_42965 (plasmid) [Microvirga ossetica]|uniref:Uncharacterized protein n=1 Tax=Microvirga ossetica TaxID=1882682 RepID=A0A1B2EYB9_9HYPH|nr:hypothetical protein BB934_42965 [Microvirga ossetica]
MLISNLNHDLGGMTLRQPVPSELSRAVSSLSGGFVQVDELKAIVIAGEAVAFPHVKIEAWHCSLLMGVYKLIRRLVVRSSVNSLPRNSRP